MVENEKQIRVVIIEDHSDFRNGLERMLSSTSTMHVVGAFSSVEKGLVHFPECDVLLLDINLPGKSGIESIHFFKKENPALQVVMMTGLDDDDNIFNAILAGADGYLLKKTPPVRVIAAVEDAAAGGTPMTPYVARRVIEHFKQNAPVQNDYQLTEREKEILSALVQGSDNREIGEKLFISYETVRNHLKHIYEKLHVNSRSQAVSKALNERIVK
ncbi:MAG: response regulator transcription factor [Bacteroidetes bacterium]|nr:response regulator transcription factor [Bacteroidota bacterium]